MDTPFEGYNAHQPHTQMDKSMCMTRSSPNYLKLTLFQETCVLKPLFRWGQFWSYQVLPFARFLATLTLTKFLYYCYYLYHAKVVFKICSNKSCKKCDIIALYSENLALPKISAFIRSSVKIWHIGVNILVPSYVDDL